MFDKIAAACIALFFVPIVLGIFVLLCRFAIWTITTDSIAQFLASGPNY